MPHSWRRRLTCARRILTATGRSICSSRKTPSECLSVPRVMTAAGAFLLRGDGTGYFAAVPASGSGIALYGEQRGVTAADFNNDGRADLAVGQRGAAMRLFMNRKTD